MKKLKSTLLAAIIFLSALTVIPIRNSLPAHAQTQFKDYDELSITLLHPYIESAITGFYGHNRRYEIGDSELEILERDGNIFTVKVQADTFEGPHNNYFTEILTFRITPSDVTLENYIHSDFIA